MPVDVAAPAPVSWSRPLGRDDVRVLVTDRRHGDLAIDVAPDVLAPRRARVVDRPWSWLRQVHGADVVVVDDQPVRGADGDALVTRRPGTVVAVHSADCAPVALVSNGPVAVVHAGWRGVVAGVLPAAVRALRELGATEIAAWLGPCIHPECYAFGAAELDEIEARLGGRVRSTTATGELALDLPAAVARSLRSVEVELVDAAVGCTACDTRWFSHRARADAGRQALVAWIES